MTPAKEILAHAGRLLLEYNESTAEIHRALQATSAALTDDKLDAVVSYGGVAISLAGDAPLLMPIRELRYNAALQARVYANLERLRRQEVKPDIALAQLKTVEFDTPRHSRFLAALLLGLAAASLGALLGADIGAITVAGVSTALGLAARQLLGRNHFNLLTLPLTAAFLGAALGGLAIRLGWTQTPSLVVIVPALMLVPGPHLINGLLDLVDNYMPMALSRLALAGSILAASAVGIIVGMALTLPNPPVADQSTPPDSLNVASDMFLAGVVTIGFAVFYNTAWAQVALAAVGGMVGHGLRFMALEAGWPLEIATFFGALAVGAIAAWIARSYKLPVAVVSFAGAVTMMPGIQMYRAFGGALQLAWLKDAAEATRVAATLGNALQACLVVAALAMGLVIAARVVAMVFRRKALIDSHTRVEQ